MSDIYWSEEKKAITYIRECWTLFPVYTIKLNKHSFFISRLSEAYFFTDECNECVLSDVKSDKCRYIKSPTKIFKPKDRLYTRVKMLMCRDLVS